MNRFIPESWLEALMRPLAMALPDAWIYVEVIAPDIRFALLMLLLGVAGVVALRGRERPVRPVLVLCAFTFLAFLPWMFTTGNGRYFVPVLLLAGVLSIALTHRLPASRMFRLTLAAGVMLVQGFALLQNSPWRPGSDWALLSWAEGPYLPLQLDDHARRQPATYVGISVISYSLLAPQFPADSRWINLSALQGAAPQAADVRRAHQFLAESPGTLRLIAPALMGGLDAAGLPNADAVRTINELLAQWQLAVSDPRTCRTLPVAAQNRAMPNEAPVLPSFWVCPLSYPVAPPPALEVPVRWAHTFEALERACPRRFPPGQERVTPMGGGAMRHYQTADMKVYVTQEGLVYYKHHRAISAVHVGTVDEVLQPGFQLDCTQIRTRSALPWLRES